MTLHQAVLLVGGRGTRMWPLTVSTPKGLIPVAGVPFLDLQIRQLAAAGIDEVLLAVGRNQLDQWESFAAVRPGVDLIVEDTPLDTAGPVVAALDRLDEHFMVFNGDVIFEADIAGFLSDVRAGPLATLALAEVDDTSAYGVVVVDDGVVLEFVEKPPVELAPARTVNAGMYVVAREAFSLYPPGRLSFERTVFPDLVAAGALGAAVVEGRWLDIGTPQLYLECTGTLLGGSSPLLEAASPFRVEGDVAGELGGRWDWIAAGATVAAGAVVEESVVLGGASIEAGAVVSGSVVGWGARIGAGASVTGATMVGADADVGESNELGFGMRIAPGAVLAPGAVTFAPPG